MQYEAVRVRCEGCSRTKVLNVTIGSEEDQDLLTADAGEFVERECKTCGQLTDHQVLG